MDIAMIILMLVFGIIGGLIGGSVFLLIKLYLNERKAKKDISQNKIILRKGEDTKMTAEIKSIDVPKINNVLPELPKESDYKTDFKKFNEANKELEKLKKAYEKGKLTYQELKDKFAYYQSKDYYKRILKDHGKE